MNKQIEQFPALQRCRAEKLDLEAELEAMEHVVQAAKEVWNTIPSVLGPDENFEIRRHAAALNALKRELNALAAAQSEQEEPLIDNDGR